IRAVVCDQNANGCFIITINENDGHRFSTAMRCGLVAMIARQDKTSRLLDETGAEPAIMLNALAYGSDIAGSCILRMQQYCLNRHGRIIPLANHLPLFLRSLTRPTCGSCC